MYTVCVCCVCCVCRRGRWTLREGRKAPNCVVHTTEGEKRHIYDSLDATKFLVLNFGSCS